MKPVSKSKPTFSRLINMCCRIKYFMDLSGDGKVNIVDFTAWLLTFIFLSLSLAAVSVFAYHLYYMIVGKEPLQNLIEYTIPLTQVTGTLVTLVYSVAFMYNTGQSSGTSQKGLFFDFDKDGKINIVDRLCAFIGVTHSVIIIVDIVLWYNNFMDVSNVVDCIAATTRLIILFLTKSYLAHEMDPRKKPGYWFIFDINHDGLFQLMDLLAMICNVTYISAVIYSYICLVFLPLSESDVWSLINLTSQLNFVLVAAFATVYLSKQPMSRRTERALGAFAAFYLLLLLRTVAEMYMMDETFKVITKLANGVVLGVTQLIMGSFLVHNKLQYNADD
mmetsp:Transcript_8514/g.12711  ORF Transcript_8514/g.12711 Transcript_8514/m.12711 type:complete len:333 (+) Transcript_8514:87-1085(+)|eukprot:CAMPEP_0185027136 /NCGR_PEP_ID=MMETSP1103-20130426/11929_1 /TAXON_ID=36769 /ORGANISM="Paraphysomonas bandaiensis, Strain Caron Lab Isolate" /LENGTH=332 /DNA_ID=CAMNT_0027561005 /DNA_START=28 /DNA_END=1026 /DNA_ORIENTATION=+